MIIVYELTSLADSHGWKLSYTAFFAKTLDKIMKIMVCASIGYGGINKIRELYSKLSKAGFEVLNHIDEKQIAALEAKTNDIQVILGIQ